MSGFTGAVQNEPRLSARLFTRESAHRFHARLRAQPSPLLRRSPRTLALRFTKVHGFADAGFLPGRGFYFLAFFDSLISYYTLLLIPKLENEAEFPLAHFLTVVRRIEGLSL